MRKGNLVTGILYLFAGALLLIAALLTDSKLDSLLFGFAGAGIAPGMMMICQYFYWHRPENQGRYQEKMEHEAIELHDELKEKLRDQSGRYAYVLGLAVICISIVLFSILGTLELIPHARLIVLYLGGYLVFQIVAGHVIFRYLLKKY